MRTLRRASVVLLLLAETAGRPVSALAQPLVVRPTAPIALFNGRDLSNFETWLVDHHGEDPDRVFSVVDQIDGAPAIRISGQHWGGLATRDRYADYRLVVEFRWGLLTWGERRNAARDSGVLVHGDGPLGNTARDMNGPWIRSIEAQVIEGGTGDFILVAGYDAGGTSTTPTLIVQAAKDRDGEDVYAPEGAPRQFEKGRINWFGRDPDWTDTLGFRGRQDVESPAGEWTRLEVTCKDRAMTIHVNGMLVNAGADASVSSGRIMLQSEGAEIFFRRVELLPLVARD
jgi:3-keto-disaccharide hydrolase